MDALFGLSMQTIMTVLLGIFAVALASVGYVALTNRTMFKMGLRNLPRRGLQTGLVIVGLMLATLIITAAFTTGDTIDHSITKRSYDQWQRTDLNIALRGSESEDAIGPEVRVPEAAVDQLQQQFATDPDIELFVPALYGKAAARDYRSGLSEPSLNLVGLDPEKQNQVGGLTLVGGGKFDLTTLGERDVLLSERAAEDLDAKKGDTLSLFIEGQKVDATVVAIVKDEQASGVLGDFDDTTRAGGLAMRLDTVQQRMGYDGQINYISVSLKGNVHSTATDAAESAAARVEAYVNTRDGRDLLNVGSQQVAVEATKLDDVKQAEEFGNIFTTFFLAMGLFSIAAGVMLIFMIFVMLAAERKPEMGMARAVGAQRSSLVQSFMSEGMSYNLVAGAIGAALGIAVAIGLIVGYLRYSLGDDFDFVDANVTLRSVIVSYCLGVVLTFITVVISSMKVSSVNIVAAIRGTPEDETPGEKRRISWRWLIASVPFMIVPPLGLYFLLRKALNVPWAWILGSLGVALGAFCIMLANSGGSEFLFSFGVSVIPLSLAGIAAYHKAPGRLTWTIIGVLLAAFWLAPFNVGEEVLGRKLNGDIEMFFLSGVMVVVSFTLIIVFNARLLSQFFMGTDATRYRVSIGTALGAASAAAAGIALGDSADGMGQLFFLAAGLLAIVAAFAFASAKFPRLAPALKMGVAYPLSNRFRTGMTLAMFSLIVFSVVTFSAVNANFSALLTGDDGDGGFQVVATQNTPIVGDLKTALQDLGSPAADDVTAIGRTTVLNGQQLVRHGGEGEWQEYPVLAADSGFLATGTLLNARAAGYESDDAVLAAVLSDPSLAILDTTVLDGFNSYDYSVDVDVENDEFEPFTMEVRNAATGKVQELTVVGFWASRLTDRFVSGVYVNAEAYTGLFGTPVFTRFWVRIADDASALETSRSIESALSADGIQADSVRQLIDDASSQDRAFTRMFQAFMALGLFVGIAALGVIAFRSVVERRQQIGMLRAIGYQTETVAATFVLESSFIALMGILSGVVGGVIVSRNLFTVGQFATDDITFSMPWSEVVIFVGIAAIVSLVMTWLPSRSAAQVPVAEALRYE